MTEPAQVCLEFRRVRDSFRESVRQLAETMRYLENEVGFAADRYAQAKERFGLCLDDYCERRRHGATMFCAVCLDRREKAANVVTCSGPMTGEER